MPAILIYILLFLGGGTIGYIVAPKKIEQHFDVRNETIVQTENKTTVQTLQGQLTIVDTKTNINLNLQKLTNFLEKIIITNVSKTNYTNLIK